MRSVTTIAREAGVLPADVNNELIRLGYQGKTDRKNCRFSPTDKAVGGYLWYEGQDAKTGKGYTCLTWSEDIADQVIASLKPVPGHVHRALLERVERLEALLLEKE